MAAGVLLILGLGNPGNRFSATRHNVGFDLVERLAVVRRLRLRRPFWRSYRFGADSAGALALAQPLTYMNRSGDVLASVMRRARASRDELLVVTDNLDLPTGEIRLKPGGGPSSHNGLRSIEAALGTTSFARLYLGIGRPTEGGIIEHVLGRFAPDERRIVDAAIERAVSVIGDDPERDLATLAGAINARRRG